jgi:DNA-binding transcriptional LysR family regulator
MPLSRYNLTSLQLFVAIAQTQSLTKAASDFGLALSAASKRISDMESVVGAKLLMRSKKGVSLTPAGRVLLKHAQAMSAAVDALANDMNDFSLGVEDRVRLWANTSAVNGFLPQVLENFLAQYPKIQIDLEEALSTEIIDALHKGNADLGIVSGNVFPQGLVSSICDSHRLVVLLQPEHPLLRKKDLKFSEVVSYEMVALNKGSALLNLLDTQAKLLRLSLRIRVQVRSFDAICRLVASGLGIAILPQPASNSIAKSLDLKIRPLSDAWAFRDLNLLQPPQLSESSLIVKNFISLAYTQRREKSD